MIVPWLESLLADFVFGWRQLVKYKGSSAAVILSLGLGIGSCMAAFRLIDALFLRPLPIAHPERLFAVTYPNLSEGAVTLEDQFDYATFRALRAAAGDQVDLLPIAVANGVDITFGADGDTEHVWREFVPGSMFSEFGLKPALGRLLTESDDRVPGAEPYAVISWDYWSRRFSRDPAVIGRRFRFGNDTLEIVGVAPEGFSGTSPGAFTDVFIPNMMNSAIGEIWNGYRVFAVPKAGNLASIEERLSGALHAYREEQVKSWRPERPKQDRDFFLAAKLRIVPAAGARSGIQRRYGLALTIFAVLVGLVLLIACVNVANLKTVQAAARARELALRVSIGAWRVRLIQLLLVENVIVALIASALGLCFSWWAAPSIAGALNTRAQPMRLVLSADWRVTLFAIALVFLVTILFGIGPALRASAMSPATALKGGTNIRGRRGLVGPLIAAQVAFCFFVLFVGGMFIATFNRMANQPTGFSSARVLTLESVSKADMPAQVWYQTLQKLRTVPGVESAALAQYALMSFNAQSRFVWANGHSPDGTWSNSSWLLGVSRDGSTP